MGAGFKSCHHHCCLWWRLSPWLPFSSSDQGPHTDSESTIDAQAETNTSKDLLLEGRTLLMMPSALLCSCHSGKEALRAECEKQGT
eukprot:3510253-Amphidinium_carterae.1